MGNPQVPNWHEAICIPFELGGRLFEAVGFLKEGEVDCPGEQAVRRADNGHLVREESDWQFLYDHRAELPPKLRNYLLVTARPVAQTRGISYLDWDKVEWYDDWHGLDVHWDQFVLVVRRRD